MAMPREHLPRLRVIDGGSPAMRREEAHVEVMAFFSEVETGALRAAEAAASVLDEMSRLAHRTAEARRQWLVLGGPDDAA